MSTPIANEQRPEREAMKRKAQLEREKAARLGKSRQHFTEREKDMAIALYYGYAMSEMLGVLAPLSAPAVFP